MLYTLCDLLKGDQDQLASKVAIVDGSCRMTYAELTRHAQRYATLLREAGLKKGDRVAIYLRRSSEAVVALFATYFAGGVAVIINEVLRTRQVNYILEHCQAFVLVTETRLFSTLTEVALNQEQIINLDEVTSPDVDVAPVATIGEDLAMIIYTSGSTGMPKGIMLGHDNLLSGAYIVSDYLRLTEDDIIISVLPFSFDYGLNQLLTALLVGGTLVIQRSLFPADVCRTLSKEGVTGLAGVPLFWQQMFQSYSPFSKTEFPGLRYITNTGGRMPEHLVGLMRKAHPHVDIYLMYGLTEAFRSTYLPPEQVDLRPTSIGKAIPNVEILVVNEQGQLCSSGEVGELVHRGANISKGYWRDPKSTARVFRPHPLQKNSNGNHEIVVYSGDFVKKDEEGYLYFVSRKDQMIKSRGFRISPQEIEGFIFSSNMVISVVAFAIPKNDVENDIVAAIIPKEAATFRDEELHEFCRKEMPDYMRPQTIWSLDQFPQTTSGKPDRLQIKERFIEAH